MSTTQIIGWVVLFASMGFGTWFALRIVNQTGKDMNRADDKQ